MINYSGLLAVAFFLICNLSFSQVKDSSESSLSGSFSSSGLYQSGNTNKFLIQGKGEIKRVNDKLETILFVHGSYGESKNKKDDNSYSGSLTADLNYQKEFSPFALQNLEYNFSKGIDLRSQSGAGLKYLFLPEANHKSSVSIAIIYDYLNLADKPGNSKSKEIRFSFRVKSKQELIDKRLIFYFMIIYQPVINNFSKANCYVESNLETPVTKILLLNANYNYGFDNVVSVGRKRADNKLTFGIKVLF
ncbi:MAG: DUF481 domain-containing protein [Bacteroidota bacterium]|nr:DUF481 domain-containing protein [Bacteroidota bacterium]